MYPTQPRTYESRGRGGSFVATAKQSENVRSDIAGEAQAPRTFAGGDGGGVVGGPQGLPFGIGVHVAIEERDQCHDAGTLVVPEAEHPEHGYGKDESQSQ